MKAQRGILGIFSLTQVATLAQASARQRARKPGPEISPGRVAREEVSARRVSRRSDLLRFPGYEQFGVVLAARAFS